MNAEPITKYDKAYFIAKFKAIPDEQWLVGMLADDAGRCCALGHCAGYVSALDPKSDERGALSEMFDYKVSAINDGMDDRYQQQTPKARILAALNDLP